MFPFITQLIAFYVALALVLLVPGYFLLKAIELKKTYFSKLEFFVVSFGLSIFSVDILMLLLGALKIPITRWSLVLAIAIFSVACFGISHKFKSTKNKKESDADKQLFSFGKNQTTLILLLLLLSVFIRTAYLQSTIVPSATDLGHHMFWSNMIVQNGIIPNYQQQNVITTTNPYSISAPINISDFIIGEHLVFAAISLISGISVISYFPIVTLLLINLMTLLAIFIFVLRLFENDGQAKNIAAASLFILGPIFAIAPPQAKFIGGGVIGNIIGNLLLPLTLYFFLRAMREKDKVLLMTAIIFSMSLFYTHHLTGFLFLFTIILIIFSTLISNLRSARLLLGEWMRMFFSLPVVTFSAFAAIFALTVYTPTYITNKAVSTVVGSASKSGHGGLSLTDFKFTVGEPRMMLAIVAILIMLAIFFSKKGLVILSSVKQGFRKYFSSANIQGLSQPAYHLIFPLSWLAVLFIISVYPSIIRIDIPSGRVGNYATYPVAILAAYALIKVLAIKRADDDASPIKYRFFFSVFALLFAYFVASGFYDNGQNMYVAATPQKTVETFRAADWLSGKLSTSDILMSDHINMTADTWVKIFFMRGYNFPFYRANLDRYDNGIDRQEKCTLNMISTPSTAEGAKCFIDLGVNFVMVNKKTDSAQFQKNFSFWQVYSSDDIEAYYRPNSN
ncbi:MAG TPA: hypothetical protein VF817_04730 [Patescibacteria group bacterium]